MLKIGSRKFRKSVSEALAYMKENSPEFYSFVNRNTWIILQSPNFGYFKLFRIARLNYGNWGCDSVWTGASIVHLAAHLKYGRSEQIPKDLEVRYLEENDSKHTGWIKKQYEL